MSHSNRENVRARQRMLFVVKYLVRLIVAVFSDGFIVVGATINVYIAPHKEVSERTLSNHRFALFGIAVYGNDCILTRYCTQGITFQLLLP